MYTSKFYFIIYFTSLVSRFSICLNCFFFMRFNLLGFLMTWTISDFFLFSSCLWRFSRLLCFCCSFCSCLAAIIAREASLTRFSSSRSACFFSNEALIPFVFTIDENLVLELFHILPDFGLPLGWSCVCFFGFSLQFEIIIV